MAFDRGQNAIGAVSYRAMAPDPTRSPRRWLLWLGVLASFLIGLVVFGVVALIVWAGVVQARAGCGSFDPTDPGNYSVVSIENDTSASVTITGYTGAECQVEQLPTELSPGQSYEDHAACGVSGSDMTSWQLVATDGHRSLGSIAVDTPRKTDGLTFRVSRATSPDRPTPAG